MLGTIKIGLIRYQRKAKGDESAAEFGTQMTGLLDETTSQVQRISRDLLPTTLARFGLESSIKDLLERVTEDAGIEVEMAVEEMQLTGEQELGLFRIVQEATNNSLKYADCKRIVVKIGRKEGEVVMRYADDGKGFDVGEAKGRKSLGLKNIESRASVLGGKAEIWSKVGEGMKVEVRIPVGGLNQIDNAHA